MKKLLALALAVFFSLVLIVATFRIIVYPTPYESMLYSIGQGCTILFSGVIVFHSVRRIIQLNGHTYKLVEQTLASILIWYSLLGLVVGIRFLSERQLVWGIFWVVLAGSIALICWVRRRMLRRAEA